MIKPWESHLEESWSKTPTLGVIRLPDRVTQVRDEDLRQRDALEEAEDSHLLNTSEGGSYAGAATPWRKAGLSCIQTSAFQ